MGRWQVNEAETLAEIRHAGVFTEEQIALITSKISFGAFILEIDEDTITSYYQGSGTAGRYKVISLARPFITVESHNPITEEVKTLTIEIQGNTMWMPSELPGFREVFNRLP